MVNKIYLQFSVEKVCFKQITFIFLACGFLSRASASRSSSGSSVSRPSTLTLAQSGVQIVFTGSHAVFRRADDPATPVRVKLPTGRFAMSTSPADDLIALGATAVDLNDGLSLLVLEEGATLIAVAPTEGQATHVVRTFDGARLFLIQDEMAPAFIKVICVDTDGRIFGMQVGSYINKSDSKTIESASNFRSEFFKAVHRGASIVEIKRTLRMQPMVSTVIWPEDVASGTASRIDVFKPSPRAKAASTRDDSGNWEVPFDIVNFPSSSNRVVATFSSGRVALGQLTSGGGGKLFSELAGERPIVWSDPRTWLETGIAPEVRFEPTDLVITDSAMNEIRIPLEHLTKRVCEGFTHVQTGQERNTFIQ